MASTVAAAIDRVRSATIPYLSASAQHSLYRNGKCLVQRDQDGSDAPWVGADLETRSVPMIDARELAAAERPTLETHGFELSARRLADPGLDFLDHEEVVRNYYSQCAALVREVTGARFVASFDHNVRSAAGKNSQLRIVGTGAMPLRRARPWIEVCEFSLVSLVDIGLKTHATGAFICLPIVWGIMRCAIRYRESAVSLAHVTCRNFSTPLFWQAQARTRMRWKTPRKWPIWLA